MGRGGNTTLWLYTASESQNKSTENGGAGKEGAAAREPDPVCENLSSMKKKVGRGIRDCADFARMGNKEGKMKMKPFGDLTCCEGGRSGRR